MKIIWTRDVPVHGGPDRTLEINNKSTQHKILRREPPPTSRTAINTVSVSVGSPHYRGVCWYTDTRKCQPNTRWDRRPCERARQSTNSNPLIQRPGANCVVFLSAKRTFRAVSFTNRLTWNNELVCFLHNHHVQVYVILSTEFFTSMWWSHRPLIARAVYLGTNVPWPARSGHQSY